MRHMQAKVRRLPEAAILVGAVICAFASGSAAAQPANLALARDGRALQPVVTAGEAGKEVRTAAANLAEYLGRMSGAEFEVQTGDGTTGLAVGTTKDFPDVHHGIKFDPADPFRRDEYLLRTHENGAYLIGATQLGAQHAAWDFLYRLGYRQFFPTDTWEVVPQKETLRLSVDVFERPDFYNRLAPRGAPWSDGKLWRRWQNRNRITSGFKLNTGHSYNSIIRRNEEAFEKHPAYLALVDGKRGGGRGDKFCISNAGLRELVVRDAIGRVDADTDSISMDPSDGGGWCECGACAKMGSVSDRVLLLANEVAKAINELGYGEKYVGFYAYNVHSPPPSVKVHPNVIASIATAFIKGGYGFEELVEGWSQQGAKLGIRDYHDVFTWSHALPRHARGGNISYLTERIPYYYENGARFINSEASDSWGANGLGYYLSTRLVWDVSAAGRADRIIEDFLQKAFREAQGPMRKFYHLIARDYDTPRSHEDLLARMYGHLADARKRTDDPEVLARLRELILYTRYVERHFDYRGASRQDQKKRAQDLYRHAYRMRDTMMVHIRALYGQLDAPKEAYPPHATGAPSKDKGPWMSNAPFTREEVSSILSTGVKTNEKTVIDFAPRTYSENLVPAADRLNLEEVRTAQFDTYRGRHTYFTWFAADNRTLTLKVKGGLIYEGMFGDITFSLYSPKEVTLEPVAEASVPADEKEHEVVLKTPYEGLHRLEWSDGGDMTSIQWPENHPMTMRSSLDDPSSPHHRWILYFYVPRDTETVGGFATSTNGRMLDGDGEEVFNFSEMEEAGYFNVPVPEGQDGTLWKMHRGTGHRMLMTVPPYLARNERELLLPEEVVERDAREQ